MVGASTCCGFSEEDFTKNDKYGWCEYEYNGEKYVVTALASYAYLHYYSDATWKDYIHYSHMGPNYTKNSTEFETFQFQFDSNGDETVYNAIVLDYCGASMMVGENDPQIIDIYMGRSGEVNAQGETFNQLKVNVTSTGTFSSNAGQKSSGGIEEKVTAIVGGFFTLVGDTFQKLQNTLGTTLSIKDKLTLTYKKSDIEQHYYFKDEVDVGTANQSDLKKKSNNETTKNVLATITVPNEIDNRSGVKETVFDSDTEIPGMPIDAYSASIGKVKFFDINFFDKDYDNGDNNWKFFRGVVSGVSHMVLYISAMLLLTMIIIRGGLLVISTMRENPEGARDAKEVMDNIVKAVCIMAFSYLIMAVLMYLYDQLLGYIVGKNTSRYLIRLIVSDVYSFNTNVVGYFKYMSMMPNYIAALKYALGYGFISSVNFVWFWFMALRMFAVGLMIITVPLTAVYELSGRTQRRGFHLDNVLQWETFMRLYVEIVFLPLVVVGSYKFLLNIIG